MSIKNSELEQIIADIQSGNLTLRRGRNKIWHK